MTDKKISELTAIDAVSGVDLLAIVDDPAGTPATKKATATQLKDFVVGAGSVSVASGKTLTASNTLTLAGTDSTTMTFPSTSATLARTDAANTFTGAQTISGGTVTTSSPVIDAAQTWNASGTTFTGLRFNAAGSSDANSASGSLLMDLQVGGSSIFNVTKAGRVYAGGGSGGSPSYSFTAATGVGMYGSSSGIRFSVSSSALVAIESTNLRLDPTFQFGFASASVTTATTPDTILTRRGAANLRLGAADAASPVAQTLSVQGRTGTNQSASTFPFRITGATGTGTGVGGPIVLQTAPAGSSGSAVNSLVDRLSVTGSGSVVVGDGANALTTTATDGFLYVPTCAGTPTGTPTTQTGTAPIVVDTTNNKLYFYSGGQWRDAGP